MKNCRELICIICPRGCRLSVTLNDDNDVLSVCGNTCKRGEVYAKNECTNPQRTVTTTVRCDDGGVVAVKTDGTISKSDVAECMRIINEATVKLPVKIGQSVIKDVFGCNIVAAANKSAKER